MLMPGRVARLAQYGCAQYSTGRLLPCLTMMWCGETGADASVTFGVASVDTDQIAATATRGSNCGQNKALAHLSSPRSDELRSGIAILTADPV
jgi:hypothetical protein